MKSSRFSSQTLLTVLMVLLGFVATYLLYTRPANSDAEAAALRVVNLKKTNTEVAERLASYESGSNELTQANTRLAAAKELLPVLETGGLDPAQYMRLNIPVRVQDALKQAGLASVDISRFGPHTEQSMPAPLIAMTFEFQFSGPLSSLDSAVKALNDSGTPTTVLEASVSVAVGSGSGGCSAVSAAAGVCLSNEVTLLVWFSRPLPTTTGNPSTTVPPAP
jgi:hypothetical protein